MTGQVSLWRKRQTEATRLDDTITVDMKGLRYGR